MLTIALQILALLALLCGVADAQQQQQQLIFEMPKEGLIRVENFRHWAGFKYEYTGFDYDTGPSSTSHRFQESYNLSSNFSILDRSLLNIQLDGQLSYNQVYSSSSVRDTGYGSGLNTQYRLQATLHEQSWHPVTFFSSREEYTAVNPYSPSSVNTVNRNGIMANLVGKTLSGRLQYEHLDQEYSGKYWTTSMISDTVSGSVTHSLRDIATTTLGGTWFDTSSGYTTGSLAGRGYTLSLSNSLTTPRKMYQLLSTAQWQDSTSSGIPQKSLTWNELLTATFGKALTASISNAYSYNLTTGVMNNDQIYQTNQARAEVRHRLLSSLDTTLNGTYITRTYLGGSEDDYGGGVTLAYTKQLPNAGRITVNLNEQYQVVDRNLALSELRAVNEEHTVAGEYVSLNLNGVITAITVIDRKTGARYDGNSDYEVDPVFARIRILPLPGTIAPGAVLLISYTVRVNPNISYGNNTFTVSSSLSLLNNRYILSGSLSYQNQSLLDGRPQYYSLANGRTAQVRAEANYAEQRYYAEYYDYSFNTAKYQYVEGGWNFTRLFPLWSTTLRLRDRYTFNQGSSYLRNNSWLNTVDAGGSVTRYLGWITQLQGSAWYVNTTGGNSPVNEVYLRLSLQMQLNQLSLSLIGQTRWRFYGSQQLRDDYVRVEMTRNF